MVRMKAIPLMILMILTMVVLHQCRHIGQASSQVVPPVRDLLTRPFLPLLSGCLDVWMSGFLDVWMSGCLIVCLSAYLVVWLSGIKADKLVRVAKWCLQ